MPALYLVATPIGNLEDITYRAVRILGAVGLIAAEDTRTTRKLLNRYGVRNRLVSFHNYSGPGRVQGLIDLLAAQDVALVSDAGTPGLSDPGYPLVKAAIQQGVPVIPVRARRLSTRPWLPLACLRTSLSTQALCRARAASAGRCSASWRPRSVPQWCSSRRIGC